MFRGNVLLAITSRHLEDEERIFNERLAPAYRTVRCHIAAATNQIVSSVSSETLPLVYQTTRRHVSGALLQEGPCM
jgi:hypothetical protein